MAAFVYNDVYNDADSTHRNDALAFERRVLVVLFQQLCTVQLLYEITIADKVSPILAGHDWESTTVGLNVRPCIDGLIFLYLMD